MRSPLLIIIFITAITTLAIVNFLALEFSLYWRYLWLDNPVHALGGASAALFVFLFPVFNMRVPNLLTLFPVLGFVFIAALCWELFEIAIGVPNLEPKFFQDAAIDITMGLLGGGIGFFVGNRIRTL